MSELKITPEAAAVNGGSPLLVRSQDGTEETVSVRVLKIAEFQEYFALLAEDDSKLAAWAVGKTLEWVEGLEDDSLFDLLEEVDRVNFTKAQRWIERQTRKAEKLAPITNRMAALQLTHTRQ
jgi:hypothetical protein